jgi:DNA-directed RNA polymerase sigma subunit (sigma70/sigma32)
MGETVVQTLLEDYEAEVQQISSKYACTDPWFTEQLTRSRAGDENAFRAICSSCLGLILDVAKKRWQPDCPLELIELVQEGNARLMKVLKRFSGAGAEEFLRQLKPAVDAWFTLLLQHPEWAQARWALFRT